jgi:hypothetical protein
MLAGASLKVAYSAPMTEQAIQSFLAKLTLLEQTTGQSVSYRLFQPFRKPIVEHVAIQKAAREVAEFIGLGDFTFVIGVAMQKENVGGHICLDRQGKDVFIEVASDAGSFPEAVAATLSHEICHKWLQVHGLECGIESENEILTDTTAVFLGFGKLMLYGCKCVNYRQEKSPEGIRQITETRNTGYLDRDQLAFVYRTVCEMRRISKADYLDGLNVEAARAVLDCDISFGHVYNPRFHDADTAQKSFAGLQEEIVNVQREFAQLDKHLAYIKAACCDTLDDFLGKGHKKLRSLHDNAYEMVKREALDPALRFLMASQAEQHFAHLRQELRQLVQESRPYLEHAGLLGRHLLRNSDHFPSPSPGMFNVVKCHQDGTRLRLPESSGELVASCPVCKYRFAYNTDPITFEDESVRKKQNWIERLWTRVGIGR